tara:strand:+ start:467 stop:1426 length:960 start_codon:yes stop_codon:yes gene_type:complete
MKFNILPIAGDASFRRFYRLKLNKSSRILVFATRDKYKNLIAYSSVNKFLRNNKILAPKLYSYNFSKGFIIIEDFGNLSFYKILLRSKNKLIIYKKLVDLLIKIQKIRPKNKIINLNKTSHKINKYSKKYLFKETNLFFDWYLPMFLTKKKAINIKKKSNKILFKIYNKLNFSNSYFVHRDYHVQNLMKVGKKIGVIDSQDTLIGNPAYDLVSLIDDVRITTSRKLKNQIYTYYLKKNSKINKKDFFEDFNILSVQRSLKIIGIFSRLFLRDRKKQYLKYIPYTWQLLKTRMNHKIFSELNEILIKNIPKKFMKKIIYK